MLGGLYGDLPPPSSSASDDDNKPTSHPSAAAVWSSSAKMAPTALRKPPGTTTLSSFTPPPSVLRSQQNAQSKPKTLANAYQAKNQTAPLRASTPAEEPIPLPPAASFQPAFVGVTASVVEEYDPAKPNDYEEYRRERKRKTMEAEMKREIERRRQEEEERERDREKERREREDRARDIDAESRLNISGEEAWKRRAAMGGGNGGAVAGGRQRSPSPTVGNGEGFAIGKSDTVGLGVGAGGQMTAAQRMMAKMGWKAGQGLGKQEQGITTPLMAKKTDRRAGVIVNASEQKQQDNANSNKKVKGVSFNGPPTRVLLLRNMVGPGEVDDELEDEVGSECAKYGTVTRVLIFEITEPNFPSEEAVRIFIQFERSEETTRAYVDLDGRYFGGRVVRAAFYDEEKFAKNELAPLPGEVPGFF